MKVTLIELVRANLAVKEMERQELPYELAVALVRLRRATQKDFEAFLELEKKLVRKYAILDENGHFKFRDSSEAPAYLEERRELEETAVEVAFSRWAVIPPENITLQALEALSVFLSFKRKG
mgnify:CR=1 FL=1